MKRLVIIAGVLLVLAGGAAGFALLRDGDAAKLPQAQDEQDKGEAPHPLTHEAMAARKYPGGPLQIEQDLGDKGGFRSYLVSYPSDGLKQYALMNVPTTPKPAAGYPVLFFNHGYIVPSQYRTLGADYQTWVNTLSRAGYIVLKPDYRGHDKSEGAASGGNWSPEYVYDVLNLVGSIKGYNQADATRIGMVGHSMGGGITMRAASASKDVKAVVTLAGVIGTADDLAYRWNRPNRPTPPPGMFGSARQILYEKYGEPKTNPEFWSTVAVTAHAKHITVPIQIHHATGDQEVPSAFSDSFVQARQAAGQPVEYYTYPGSDHVFSGQIDLVLRRTLAFFDSVLKQ